MDPSVGSIVHYVSYGTPGVEYGRECRAAVVTAVGTLPLARSGVEIDSGQAHLVVDLAVFNPTGMFFNQGCVYEHPDNGPGGEPRGGTWHWPERVS